MLILRAGGAAHVTDMVQQAVGQKNQGASLQPIEEKGSNQTDSKHNSERNKKKSANPKPKGHRVAHRFVVEYLEWRTLHGGVEKRLELEKAHVSAWGVTWSKVSFSLDLTRQSATSHPR
jgi:hypothetical protein